MSEPSAFNPPQFFNGEEFAISERSRCSIVPPGGFFPMHASLHSESMLVPKALRR